MGRNWSHGFLLPSNEGPEPRDRRRDDVAADPRLVRFRVNATSDQDHSTTGSPEMTATLSPQLNDTTAIGRDAALVVDHAVKRFNVADKRRR